MEKHRTACWQLRSICPNSLEDDFHNNLTSWCEMLDGPKLLAILWFTEGQRIIVSVRFSKGGTLLVITAKQKVQQRLHHCLTPWLSLLLLRFVTFHENMKFIAALISLQGFSAMQPKPPKKKRNHCSVQNALSDNCMENIIKFLFPKMTGQNDWQDESLTGHYFQPCHIRLLTPCKICFTLGLFANYFSTKSFSLSLKSNMNVP